MPFSVSGSLCCMSKSLVLSTFNLFQTHLVLTFVPMSPGACLDLWTGHAERVVNAVLFTFWLAPIMVLSKVINIFWMAVRRLFMCCQFTATIPSLAGFCVTVTCFAVWSCLFGCMCV